MLLPNKERFFEMIRETAKIIENLNEWRYGQAVFNLTHDTFPEEADLIRATENDCFYDDKKVEDFLLNLKIHLGLAVEKEIIKKLVNNYKPIIKTSEFIEFELKNNKSVYSFKEIKNNKLFYRLGESMETLKLRGDKV